MPGSRPASARGFPAKPVGLASGPLPDRTSRLAALRLPAVDAQRPEGLNLHMTTSQAGQGHGERWSSRTWALLAVLCAALFLDSMDVSMVGVALPSIRADLGVSTPPCNGWSAATCSATAVSSLSAARPPAFSPSVT